MKTDKENPRHINFFINSNGSVGWLMMSGRRSGSGWSYTSTDQDNYWPNQGKRLACLYEDGQLHLEGTVVNPEAFATALANAMKAYNRGLTVVRDESAA